MDKELREELVNAMHRSHGTSYGSQLDETDEIVVDDTYQAILKLFKREMLRLIGLYEEYIALLGKEIDETATIASIHGWKSSRYEQGKEMREKIAELRKKVEVDK
jgi:hypothetical protein